MTATTQTTTEAAAVQKVRLNSLRTARRNFLRSVAEMEAVADGTREHNRRRIHSDALGDTYMRARARWQEVQ